MQNSRSSRYELMRRIRPTCAALLVLGILIGSAAAYRFATPVSGAAPPRLPPAVVVDTALATLGDVPVYLDSLGTVQAFYTVTVTPRVDGALDRVAFVEGQMVKAGDLLAQIDPRPYQAAYDQAVATKDKDAAQLAIAQSDLERHIALAPQGFVSRQVLETQRGLVA